MAADTLRVYSLAPELYRGGFRRRDNGVDIPWPRSGVHLLAVGKSAGRTAIGLRSALGARLESALVIVPPGAPAPGPQARRVRVLRAEHPVPSAGSAAAGAAALEFARRAGPDDLLIVAVSGGASALMVAPVPGISVDRLAEVNRRLLSSGAAIEEMNAIRGALSRIKNGRLARATKAKLLTLVLSDVGGDIAYVGSGPTLARNHAPDPKLLEQVAPGLPTAPPVRSRRHPSTLLADPAHLVAAATAALTAAGFRVVHAADRADSPTVASRLRQLAGVSKSLPPGSAWIEACEPVLRVPKHAGVGGRNTHLGLGLAAELSVGTAALVAGSDGIDGSASVAGVAIDHRSAERMGAARQDALKRFDSGSVVMASRAVTAIAPGPTGVNLRDLHIVVRR